MAEAIVITTDDSLVTKTTTTSTAAGEVQQLADGRAGIYNSNVDSSTSSNLPFTVTGRYVLTKTAGITLLAGQAVYWDHSSNSATYRSVSDRDFFIGVAVADAGSSQTFVHVDLNKRPIYKCDIASDAVLTVPVGTHAVGGFGYPVKMGTATILELSATNEAQKNDLLSLESFTVGSNWIVEGAFRVMSDGAGTTPDFSIGVASATHATDSDTIAESCFLHLDGNNVNINAESDDGTTEVVATDTTIDYTEGSELSSRVEFMLDGRNESDIQIYLNGSLILSSTVFTLGAATGPLRLLAHLEKTAGTDTYKVAVDWLRVRTAQD